MFLVLSHIHTLYLNIDSSAIFPSPLQAIPARLSGLLPPPSTAPAWPRDAVRLAEARGCELIELRAGYVGVVTGERRVDSDDVVGIHVRKEVVLTDTTTNCLPQGRTKYLLFNFLCVYSL